MQNRGKFTGDELIDFMGHDDAVVTGKKQFLQVCILQYWYDPTNSAISPKAPNIGIWEYDERRQAKCLVRNAEMPAYHGCAKYAGKLEHPVL